MSPSPIPLTINNYKTKHRKYNPIERNSIETF